MDVLMFLLSCIAAPSGLLCSLGVMVLLAVVVVILQKATEPPTADQDGHYDLEQGKEVK